MVHGGIARGCVHGTSLRRARASSADRDRGEDVAWRALPQSLAATATAVLFGRFIYDVFFVTFAFAFAFACARTR